MLFLSSLYPANINLHKSIYDIVKKLESEYSLLNFLLLGHNSPAQSIFFSLDTAFCIEGRDAIP